MRKVSLLVITQSVCAFIALILSFLILYTNKTLSFLELLRWTLFFYVFFASFSVAIFSSKLFKDKVLTLMSFIFTVLTISFLLGFILFALVDSKFNLSKIDWLVAIQKAVNFDTTFLGLVFLFVVLTIVLYCTVLDRRFILFFKGGVFGKGKLKQIDANLENSHWLTKQEREKIFKHYTYTELSNISKDGVPVLSKLNEKGKNMEIALQSPSHSLIIGSTGSGKTTTFVNPMIQILATTKAGSSMVITDPKGELFALHSKYLKSRGYDVKVVDLRDAYSSFRWNPLDGIWDMYQSYANAQNNVFERTDNAKESGLIFGEPELSFKDVKVWYEFDGKAFSSLDKLIESIKIFKKKTFDEVYEDLNDLVTVLIPIENPRDPMWEKGARSIVLAVLLAMLEDSEVEELGMTKEKFNFFNMTKILQSSSDDYFELKNYFGGRNVLSRALSLSKQVCDCAEQTRASYMSIVYEKLTMFNDAGICALTSTSDFSSSSLADRPTALFLKIPDEKDTRHNLASMFILDIYKSLIKVATKNDDLSLPRNVYFILDEFGNMPRIEKFDKMITVGRSRKIWFNMVIQSYAQLSNVYGETVADIIKANCGIKMFIGSNDINTCKEYSDLCGNITVVTQSSSSSSESESINLSNQIQTRPLIYPSELQRLNKPGDIGHAIVVTFGNYPLKSYFTPSFKVPFYVTGKMDISNLLQNVFDEDKIFYDVKKRNDIIIKLNQNENSTSKGTTKKSKEKNISQKNAMETPQTGSEISDLETLVGMFNEFKQNNPNASLEEFLTKSKKGGKKKNGKIE